MKTQSFLRLFLQAAAALALLLLAGTRLSAQAPPGILNYQGRLVSNGVNYDGPGYFKFSLVQGTNGPTLWSNDGTTNGPPNSAVKLTVLRGLYNVLLGDTTDADLQGMTASISANVFTNADVRLRVWFGMAPVGTFDLLSPDHRIATVGYAMMAASLPPGAIQSEQLPADPEFDGTVSAEEFSGIEFSGAQAQFLEIWTDTLDLPSTAGLGYGGISMGGSPFLHDYGIENTFVGSDAGNFLLTGSGNVGVGAEALDSLTSGFENTASGAHALQANTVGKYNSAHGNFALRHNTVGDFNIAHGARALAENLDGSYNAASGAFALELNTSGAFNVAAGSYAMSRNTTGNHNTGTGYRSLAENESGSGNAALGSFALRDLLQGNDNIGIGYEAGRNLTNGSNNIYIGSGGPPVESNWIRIGTPGVHQATQIAGTIFAADMVARNVSLTSDLGLPETDGFSSFGLTLNGVSFLHAYGSENTFAGSGAGNFAMTGDANTAVGHAALSSNTSGRVNTAVGHEALAANTTGEGNTALGISSLYANEIGQFNTGLGWLALASTQQGSQSTGVGSSALRWLTSGNDNTALGTLALGNLTNGSHNLALGSSAGEALFAGNHNIYLASSGPPEESRTIRIGSGWQTNTYIAGISGVIVSGGDPVYVTSNGQLGTQLSSGRFKKDIQDMGATSDVLLDLRPVSFRYQDEIDPSGRLQFGLVAEEVEKVAPELVLYDTSNAPHTVRYEAVNAMLLNEFQKQSHRVQQQAQTISKLEHRVGDLNSRLDQLTLLIDQLQSQIKQRDSQTVPPAVSVNSVTR